MRFNEKHTKINIQFWHQESYYATTYIEKNIYYFLLPISIESIVLGSNIRNGDLDGFTRFEVS